MRWSTQKREVSPQFPIFWTWGWNLDLVGEGMLERVVWVAEKWVPVIPDLKNLFEICLFYLPKICPLGTGEQPKEAYWGKLAAGCCWLLCIAGARKEGTHWDQKTKPLSTKMFFLSSVLTKLDIMAAVKGKILEWPRFIFTEQAGKKDECRAEYIEWIFNSRCLEAREKMANRDLRNFKYKTRAQNKWSGTFHHVQNQFRMDQRPQHKS